MNRKTTSGVTSSPNSAPPSSPTPTRHWLPLIGAWLVVLVPSVWGIWQVVLKSLALFR